MVGTGRSEIEGIDEHTEDREYNSNPVRGIEDLLNKGIDIDSGKEEDSVE